MGKEFVIVFRKYKYGKCNADRPTESLEIVLRKLHWKFKPVRRDIEIRQLQLQEFSGNPSKGT